jgi:hypothetical protein
MGVSILILIELVVALILIIVGILKKNKIALVIGGVLGVGGIVLIYLIGQTLSTM